MKSRPFQSVGVVLAVVLVCVIALVFAYAQITQTPAKTAASTQAVSATSSEQITSDALDRAATEYDEMSASIQAASLREATSTKWSVQVASCNYLQMCYSGNSLETDIGATSSSFGDLLRVTNLKTGDTFAIGVLPVGESYASGFTGYDLGYGPLNTPYGELSLSGDLVRAKVYASTEPIEANGKRGKVLKEMTFNLASGKLDADYQMAVEARKQIGLSPGEYFFSQSSSTSSLMARADSGKYTVVVPDIVTTLGKKEEEDIGASLTDILGWGAGTNALIIQPDKRNQILFTANDGGKDGYIFILDLDQKKIVSATPVARTFSEFAPNVFSPTEEQYVSVSRCDDQACTDCMNVKGEQYSYTPQQCPGYASSLSVYDPFTHQTVTIGKLPPGYSYAGKIAYSNQMADGSEYPIGKLDWSPLTNSIQADVYRVNESFHEDGSRKVAKRIVIKPDQATVTF